MNKTIYFGLLFIFLILIQVFVLNNVLFLGYVNPYLYIIFIFLYPVKKNRFVFLFLAFILGLSVDFFSDSGGIHAFSTLTIAYLRLFFISVFFRKYEIDYPFFNLKIVKMVPKEPPPPRPPPHPRLGKQKPITRQTKTKKTLWV